MKKRPSIQTKQQFFISRLKKEAFNWTVEYFERGKEKKTGENIKKGLINRQNNYFFSKG